MRTSLSATPHGIASPLLVRDPKGDREAGKAKSPTPKPHRITSHHALVTLSYPAANHVSNRGRHKGGRAQRPAAA